MHSPKGNTHSWHTKGFIEYQGCLYVYGPFIPFRTAGQIVEEKNITLLLSALSLLSPDSQVHLKTLLISDNGDLMILSPSITRQLLKLQPNEQKILDYECFGGQAQLAMGVFSYYLLSGRYPYPERNPEDIHESIQKHRYVALSTFRKDLPPHLLSSITASLESQASSDMEEWKMLLPQIFSLAETPPSPENMITAEREREHLSRRQARTRFWKKRGLLIGAVSLTATFIIGIVVSLIISSLRLDYNIDKTPREVVELYFHSIDQLNARGVMESLDSGVGKDIIREVSTLQAISKVRQAYERQALAINTSETENDQLLQPTESPYGIYNLQIAVHGDSFIATYERWVSFVGEDSRVESLGLRIREELRMRWKKNRWVISEILLLSEEEISPASGSSP